VRPHDRGPGISYYNGKGTTRADAYAGAMMEAIERHAGERYDGPVIDASHYNLRRQHACVDPLEIHIPMGRNYSEHLLLEWVLGFDLLTRRPTYAPLNCVVSPYTTFSGMPLFYSITNGLASGNTRVMPFATRSARWSNEMHRRWQWQARTSDLQLRRSCRISDLVGSIAGAQRGAADLASRIAPSRSNAGPQAERAGLEVQLLTSGTGIATIGCTIAEPQGLPIVMNAHSGCGTHPDARIALTRALTEAAQTRLTCIQGGREDLPDLARTSGAAPAET
jgi:ribosomal protein S12 methylthiotransferase accessory factor